MHASTIGERSFLSVRVEALESIKWVALVLMLVEHGCFFVFDRMPVYVMLIGRSVFPLFAMTLAIGVSGTHPADRAAYGKLLVRMLSWAIVAAAAGSLVRDPLPGNVLFTLALGVLVHSAWATLHWSRWLIAGGSLVMGFAVEYGPGGVLAVTLLCAWARNQRTPRGILLLITALALICVANGNLFAMFAPLIAWAVDHGGMKLPRVPRFFYWAYVGQWPAFAFMRAVL